MPAGFLKEVVNLSAVHGEDGGLDFDRFSFCETYRYTRVCFASALTGVKVRTRIPGTVYNEVKPALSTVDGSTPLTFSESL